MSDQGENPTGEQLRAEMKQLLNEIKQFRTQAEQHLKAAEAARKKADEDASYANQAKINTEEHSKATAVFKGTAEADLNSIATNKKNYEELVAAVTVGKATIEADIKAIAESRKAVEQTSGVVTESGEEITAQVEKVNDAKAVTDTLLKEVTELRDKTIQARNKTDEAETQTEQLFAQANDLATKITAAHETSAALSEEMDGLLSGAKADRENLTEIATHLAKSDAIATKHEERVAELALKLEELNKQAVDLLPGATSAGLASAFAKQKTRFGDPQKRWLRTFVCCIVGLAVVSLPSFLNAIFGKNIFGGPADSTWSESLRMLTMRLPIMIPLVWLAIYAGRNYMLSLRLEEDYAYKEALSTAFEGYRRQMEKIVASDATGPAPLTTLCINVLRALAERPGRIYEGKNYDINLITETHGAAQKLSELSKQEIAAK